ncbi:hypothetical protein CBS101457_005608 [Exobasidium rhododendri]|nr:hypothetical protein CBS101457_005608 [Exobasidium rhododendri]
MQSSSAGSLLRVLDHSTILEPNEPLQRMMSNLEKHHLIHIVLSWIEDAQFSPSPNVLPPMLSRRAPRQVVPRINIDDAPSQDNSSQRIGTSSFLDLHEDRRARSYRELTSLWLHSMSDAKVPRSRAVDRILNVDWPTGLTYAMVATIAFENVRANPLKRMWQTVRLDYGEEEEIRAFKEKGESITPAQFRDRFSSELQHYCSHALFLDAAIQSTEDALEDPTALLDPLPENWCNFFTHLRVVTNSTPVEICTTGLHILHIPHSSWCLISGALGRGGSEVREMALTALANSLGARRVKMAHEALKGVDLVVEMGDMAELNGKDPLALRDVLLNAGLIGEQQGEGETDEVETGEGVPGGKGRAMKRGEAEEGPLVRAEKRKRNDATGMYADVEERQIAWQENQFDVGDPRHPVVQRQAQRNKGRREHKRSREADELFGKRQALPRLERIQYQLQLPFPELTGYGSVSKESSQAHPITLRLNGTHVLAGLRTMVLTGMDETSPQSDTSHDFAGLPTWLSEVRSTRVTIDQAGQIQP